MNKLYSIICILLTGFSNFAFSTEKPTKPPLTYHIIPDFNENVGLFGITNFVLRYIGLWENNNWSDNVTVTGLKIDFGTKGLYYEESKGLNWWEYYFEPINLGDTVNSSPLFISSRDADKTIWKKARFEYLDPSYASYLNNKYIKVKQPILEKINNFFDENLKNNYVIGVHYRGTDKYKEVPRINYDKILNVIYSCIKDVPINQDYKLFIATDEQQFLDYVREIFPEKVVFTDSLRSTTREGVHFMYKHSSLVGEEAIIDAMLLSKSDILIRTRSNLSTWSTVCNPSLPVIMLDGFLEN